MWQEFWFLRLKYKASFKNTLLRKADEAFKKNDRERCVKVIERLYEIFDGEIEFYYINAESLDWRELN